MSIKLRLTLLVSLLLLGFLATYLVLRVLERKEVEHMAGEERRARAQLLTHWIDLTSRALPQFVGDAAQSEEFATLLANASSPETERKISASLTSAGLDFLWVINAQGQPARHFAAPGRPPTAGFPVPANEFVALVRETPTPRFFAVAAGELVELAVRRTSTRAEAAEWLVVGRRWDEAQTRALAELTESEVSIRDANELNQPPAGAARLVLLRPLVDWQGHVLRTLRVDHDLSSLERSTQADWQQTRLFFAFGLLVLVAITLALRNWVLRPLSTIGESLARNDAQPVQTLSQEKSEMGRLAQLVQSSFAQRETLEREVQERTAAQQALERSEAELRRTFEERARLGRDLHDGVIQSLYAAGMGLAGIRMQLRPDQTEAAARLEQTRAALNETIHDVRNFIIGLEPEALKLQTFSQAVAALLETMHSLRPFRSDVQIDESLATRLTLAQRVHALQIAREAVSNALRHGAADHLWVTLRPAGVFAEFEIRDNGSGFDLQENASSGHGLRNLAQRARELGAELSVDSKPNAGTRVKLVFSLHHYD